METRTLYFKRHPLEGSLTIGRLGDLLPAEVGWYALEPRPSLPRREGRAVRGPLAGLAPLATALPTGWDELPLLSASWYGERQWVHLHDAQPLSRTPAYLYHWSAEPLDDADEILQGLRIRTQNVLSWQDLDRFGLEHTVALPQTLQVEHYFRAGRRLTWRLLPPTHQESRA